MLHHFLRRRSVLSDLLLAVLISALAASALPLHFLFGQENENINLTTTIEAALTFTTTHNNFGSLNPGISADATTTLVVSTNNTNGWNVTLYGDEVGTTTQAMNLDTDASVEITDLDPQWIPNAATTSAGNAVAVTDGDDVLAFRVMSASGTNQFLAPTWWGTDDTPFTNARWAGFASSSASDLRIGDTSGPTDVEARNTVQYYLDVPASQTVGDYTAPLTYTATVN